ncbi:MAG: ATP-binding protein [Verrucomicrobiota bacterium]
MKSIRRSLTSWLVCGLAVILLAAGAGVYRAVQISLLNAVDAELAVDASVVRFMVRGDDDEDDTPGSEPDGRRGGGGPGPGRLSGRVPEFEEPQSGSYFQAWSSAGQILERSPSLGSLNLPTPDTTADFSNPAFNSVNRENKTTLRTMTFQVSGGKGRSRRPGRRDAGATIVTVAKDLNSVDETLTSLAGGLALVALLATGGAILLVTISLNRGLKPLTTLGNQSQSIDVTSLDARFHSAGAPAELLPVYSRLNDLLNRIQKSFDRERRFSSDLAHEMRTPLAELKMLSELALKWPDESGPDSHQEALDLTERLESMITNLLALARWESGEADLKNEPVNLASLVDDCWQRRAPAANEKNIVLQRDLDDAPTWNTDPDMLRHIVDNLIANAITYTPEGKQIGIFGHADGIEVANRAPGLTQNDVDQFFDRYWRLDPARANNSKNVGLGLSIAKSCAQALNLHLSARLEDANVRFFLQKT